MDPEKMSNGRQAVSNRWKMEEKESKRGQKLYYYLSRLHEKELKDLHAYFNSPLLGNSPQMARMLLTIQAQVLGTDRKTIDADLFQAEFFPNEPLDEKKRKYIRIRLVQLMSKVLDFVAFMEYKEDTNAHHVHLLKAMHTRGWEKYFERTYQEIEAMPPKKDFGEYHLYRLRREIVRNDHLASKARTVQETNLEETAERIDIYSVFLALKYGSAVIHGNLGTKTTISLKYTEDSIACATTQPYCEILEVRAYYHAYQMIARMDDEPMAAKNHFEELRNILACPEVLDKSEYTDWLGMAVNFCVTSIAKGNSEYITVIRDLYTEALGTGNLTVGGMIPLAIFQSIVIRMCKLDEYAWSAKFVETWRGKIAGDKDDLNYFLFRAYIHLLNKEFDRTIELLYNKIGAIEEVTANLTARNYLMRAALAIKEYQWLIAQLEAYRQYVLRHKHLSKKNKAIHLKLAELYTKVAKAWIGNPDKTKQKLESIKQSLISNNETSTYFWFYRTLLDEIEKASKT